MTEPLIPPNLDWTDDGAPVSRTFGDVYFSREDGLAETRAVFLEGCGLPAAWSGRRHFTVAELGFGTGLNILALLDLWIRHRPNGGCLHIWSVEAHPLDRAAAERAHAAWPDLTDLSQALLRQWPKRLPGLHRIDLPELGAVLDLAFGEAEAMLDGWTGRADAWFLDGFAPSANPAMWSDRILGLVAARSAPGARIATFTVAGQVRRGLAAHGFAVEKRPGHGRKRERLEAILPGVSADPPGPGRVVIVGAGIAGASLVRAFRHLGVTPTVIEADHPGAAASGAPAALVTPRLDAGGGPDAALAAQAFHRAVHLYEAETPRAVLAHGVLRLSKSRDDQARLLRIAGQPLWPPGAISGAPGGVQLNQALVIEPSSVLTPWLDGADIRHGRVKAIGPGQTLHLDTGEIIEADTVIVAAGWGSAGLGLDAVRPVRGQLAWADGEPSESPVIWGAGYAIPTRTGLLVGATHDRADTSSTTSDADTTRLLDGLRLHRPALASRLVAPQARAAIRATTPDHRPLCGEISPGVWALAGLGGRGFSWSPLLAEHVAASVTATPSPLSRDFIDRLDPLRLARPS